jgi:hypothetical protein
MTVRSEFATGRLSPCPSTSSSRASSAVNPQGSAEPRCELFWRAHVAKEDGSSLHLHFGDGEADVYLPDDGMMANHISGRDPWDLLMRGARAAKWVILPLDCPTCLTQPGQRAELPEGLDIDVVLVESGAGLRALIESN